MRADQILDGVELITPECVEACKDIAKGHDLKDSDTFIKVLREMEVHFSEQVSYQLKQSIT